MTDSTRKKSSRNSGSLWAAILGAAFTMVLSLPVPASAGLYHPEPAACSFGSDGGAATTFPNGRNLAFQQETDRLYFPADFPASSALYGFDASTPCPATYPLLPGFEPLVVPALDVNTITIAVDDTSFVSKGNVYVTGGNWLLGYDAAGNALPGFPKDNEKFHWVAVAVDPSGNPWTLANTNGGGLDGLNIRQFSPSGTELENVIPVAGLTTPGSTLAFAANGDLYLSGQGIWKFRAPDYGDPVKFAPDFGNVTVDRSSGDVYVASKKQIRRFDSAGNLLEQFPEPPLSGSSFPQFAGIAIDEASKTVYAYERDVESGKIGVFEAATLPDLTTTSPSGFGETTVTLNGTVRPDGLSLTDCHFEYLTEAAYEEGGFSDLSSGGEAPCTPAFGSIPTAGTTAVSAAIGGLTPGVTYRFRLVAENANGGNESKGVPASFTLGLPAVETVGSPLRTATTARLDSRVDPRGLPTTYHFEYLTEAAYQANLAASEPPFEGAVSTPDRSAGAGSLIRLVSEQVEGLSPNTTYRYRLLADNGAFGGAVAGEARAFTTRATDEPLGHGHFPGPRGSDRAWELVSLPDPSGNPVANATGISDDGGRAAYLVTGGTGLSETGTFFNYLYARRPAGAHPTTGWQTASVFPSRQDATYSAWRPPAADDDLSAILGVNLDLVTGGAAAAWRIPTEEGSPSKLYEAKAGSYGNLYFVSEDGSRVLLVLEGGSFDKAHPSPGGVAQLYDVSSGVPRLASLLPGEKVPSCGVKEGPGLFDWPSNWVPRTTHWVSADGSRAFFNSAGSSIGCPVKHLYMRDFAAEESFLLDGPPLEGPNCAGVLIRSTADAAYLWTQSVLDPDDEPLAGSCDGDAVSETVPGGDVYRYDLDSHEAGCLTCIEGMGPADVIIGGASGRDGGSIAVAPQGSRVYFTSTARLLAGTPEPGSPAIYRIDTTSDELAYVGPLEANDRIGENPRGSFDHEGTAITPDGRFLAFRSAAPALDALSGSDNGNTPQLYLYDDQERSLLCVSCPLDGSAPRAASAKGIITQADPAPNMTSLANDGTFAFATPSALVGADQNTAAAGQDPNGGQDVYEWRDGRPLLVSDGLTEWPSGAQPQVSAISPSGRDLFFVAAAQYTQDALDGYARLYDARIGGGIAFPPLPKPCPLEVCQGIPKGAPEEQAPGTGAFQGPGNATPPKGARRCPKGKRKLRRKGKVRCAKRHAEKRPQRRANHERRAGR